MFSLIPFYLAGSILAGALLVLVSRNVRNRSLASWIRRLGITVTPALVLIFFVFTGWQRHRTYEMEPLFRPALEYLMAGAPQEINREFPVVLKRVSGQNHDCFEAFDSKSLTEYLRTHAARPVRVTYTITYDFFRTRNIQISKCGRIRASLRRCASRCPRDRGEERAGLEACPVFRVVNWHKYVQ